VTNFNKRKNSSLPIRKLDELSINRIAAGEVIERPAAAVKELIENAIDAMASSISIFFSHGGKTLIKVIDDGHGIRKEEMKLALASHATSKLMENDLSNVETLGFRGEALSSIAAVSKLSIKSIHRESYEAAEINSFAGKSNEIKPAALSLGTTVEIRELFYSTPARLKFLKSDRAETQALFDAVKRLALSSPGIRIFLQDITKEPKKILLDLPKEKLEGQYFDRVEKILGRNFSENCVELLYENNGYTISGFASLPTNSHGTSINQYCFVNNRPVKDKLLLGAIRAAYFDFMPKDRFPAIVIYIKCDSNLVDINVHPMKSEVRFKVPKDVRSLVINSVKASLSRRGLKSNTVLSAKTLNSFLPRILSDSNNILINSQVSDGEQIDKQRDLTDDHSWFSGKVEENLELELNNSNDLPLGVAKAQLHTNFIVSQTSNGVILVDQHAAHERITYEQLKLQFQMKRVESQDLLIPEIIELVGNQKEIILDFAELLLKIGFVVEAFGEKAVCIRSVPALLGSSDLRNLITDLIEELLVVGQLDSLERRLDAIISRISCHGSVRSGRKMNAQEMNELLRKMESTPFSAQCNHGRPTFIELKLNDIEKLFGRS
tara:strand:+ start:354 stop:2174 length:1821 start_codon:yes stop_codon:yes gene_type:complete